MEKKLTLYFLRDLLYRVFETFARVYLPTKLKPVKTITLCGHQGAVWDVISALYY